MIILTTWIYLQSTSLSHSQPSIMHFPDESFDCLKDLCTISQTTTNYQPIKATRAPECRHMSCLGLQGVVEHPINQSFNQSNHQQIKQPTNQTTNRSNNQQINQSNLPEYRHLNCPGLQGGVGQDDGSSLPSMQSVDPSQYLGFHYNNEDMIKISKI